MSKEKEMKVAPGMYVEFSYSLYDDATGNLLFEVPADRPDMMVYGANPEVVPGLAVAMEGLTEGSKFSCTLPPQAAFGARNEEDVLELDRAIFERDGQLAEEVKEGAMLPMMTADGQRVAGVVREIGKDKIKMDFNHPFAGMTVRYDGEIKKVREATAEDIHTDGGCGGGCGGCGGGCGTDNDSACGCESGGCGCK